jgi:hypothetical protein
MTTAPKNKKHGMDWIAGEARLNSAATEVANRVMPKALALESG